MYHVVSVKTGYENKAVKELLKRIEIIEGASHYIKAYVFERLIKKNQKETKENILPGYVVLKIDTNKQASTLPAEIWHLIMGVSFVNKIIGTISEMEFRNIENKAKEETIEITEPAIIEVADMIEELEEKETYFEEQLGKEKRNKRIFNTLQKTREKIRRCYAYLKNIEKLNSYSVIKGKSKVFVFPQKIQKVISGINKPLDMLYEIIRFSQ